MAEAYKKKGSGFNKISTSYIIIIIYKPKSQIWARNCETVSSFDVVVYSRVCTDIVQLVHVYTRCQVVCTCNGWLNMVRMVFDGIPAVQDVFSMHLSSQLRLSYTRLVIAVAVFLASCICVLADGWNDWLYQWIGYDNWHYSRDFDITADQVQGKTVWLKCDGLDTVATIRYTVDWETAAREMSCDLLWEKRPVFNFQ